MSQNFLHLKTCKNRTFFKNIIHLWVLPNIGINNIDVVLKACLIYFIADT